MPVLPLLIAATVSLLAPGPAAAQDPQEPTPIVIQIHAPLIETNWQEAPGGVSLIEAGDISNGRVLLQPADALSLAPGVLVQNRDNFAQNPRVSIRGFGARAAFGIRGVRVRLDGIPLTAVDGQAQIDAIDPATIAGIEVLRSANAVLHGNGSGGLLDYRSYHPRQAARADAQLQSGGFGLQRLHYAMGVRSDRAAGRASLSELRQRGFREQSRVRRRNAGLRVDLQQDRRDWSFILNHLHNPLAQDPGGLTETEWRQDPARAAPLARIMNAGQRVTQNIASLGMTQQLGRPRHRLQAQTWFTGRDFHQQLPFPGDSLIRLDRQVFGGVLGYQRPLGDMTLHAQLGAETQRDDRQRHCRGTDLLPFNCRKGSMSDLALDQRESATNTGLGVQLAIPVGVHDQGRWLLGLRHDRLRLAIDDRLQAGGMDSSGARSYHETHYSLGYSHALGTGWTGFGQFATSFEAPTFTEFANPQGSGFRRDLEPQHSRSIELGLRGRGTRFQLDASLFSVRVTNEIVVDDDPGVTIDDERSFFRNAGRTRRDGVELGWRWQPASLPRFALAGALTYMNARFDDTSRNRLPGLPHWSAFMDAEYNSTRGWFAGVAVQHVGGRYADDANRVAVDAQTVTDLRLGRTLSRPGYEARLVAGIENLFDSDHLGNLRVNARNGRYFEPGPGWRYYLGLEIRLE